MEEKERDKLQNQSETTAVTGTPEPSEKTAIQAQGTSVEQTKTAASDHGVTVEQTKTEASNHGVTVTQTKTKETLETVRRVATPDAAVEMVQTKTKETTETVRRVGTQETSVTVAHTKETNTTKRSGSPDVKFDVNWSDLNEKALLSGPVEEVKTDSDVLPFTDMKEEGTDEAESDDGTEEMPAFEEDVVPAPEQMQAFEEDAVPGEGAETITFEESKDAGQEVASSEMLFSETSETEPFSETGASSEAEPFSTSEAVSETETFSETEPFSETEDSSEPESLSESENHSGAEGLSEPELLSEPERRSESENRSEPEHEENTKTPTEKRTTFLEEPELPGEEPEDMRTVVGVRFRTAGKAYYFDAGDLEVRRGSNVIVETIRGIEFGTVVGNPMRLNAAKLKQPLKKVVRLATPEDIETQENNKIREREAFKICQEKIRKHGLDMKLIDAEYTFDNSKVLFYFTADGRVDFRELVKDLAGVFRTRIELRQIGVRDETKILGGYGVCGRPLCCHTFLSDFAPVSIKMAKEQNLSLNPTKISGVCGRLMCCLKNEEETYEELNRNLPRPGDEVQGNDGLVGEVESVNVLRQKVRILVEVDDEKEIHEYNADEITLLRKKRRGSRGGARGAAKGGDHEKKGTREGTHPGEGTHSGVRDFHRDRPHGPARSRDGMKPDADGRDIMENTGREATEGKRESRKEFRRDSRRDFGKPGVKDGRRDFGKTSARENSLEKENGRNFGNASGRDNNFGKESGKGTGRDNSFGKEPGKGFRRGGSFGKNAGKGTLRENDPVGVGRETAIDSIGGVSGETTENSGRRGGRDSGRDYSKRDRRGRSRNGGRGSRRYGSRGETQNTDAPRGREGETQRDRSALKSQESGSGNTEQ